MWKLPTAASATAALLLIGLNSGAMAEEVPPGKKIFLKHKCQQCHTITALNVTKTEGEEEEEETVEGEEKVDPPDLSGAGKERTAEWHAKWLKKEEKTSKGRKHKKKFKGTAEELTVLSAWMATLKHDVTKDKQDGAAKVKAGAPAVKKDTASKAKTGVPAVGKDTLSKAKTGVPAVKKDTVSKAKTSASKANVVVPAAKKDSISKAKVVAPPVRKDSAAKATTPAVRKDSSVKAGVPAAGKDSLSKARKDSISKDIKAK